MNTSRSITVVVVVVVVLVGLGLAVRQYIADRKRVEQLERFVVSQHNRAQEALQQLPQQPRGISGGQGYPSDDEDRAGSTYAGGDAKRAPPRDYGPGPTGSTSSSSSSSSSSRPNSSTDKEFDDFADELENGKLLGMN